MKRKLWKILLVAIFSPIYLYPQGNNQGCIKGDCLNGKGIYIFSNGDKYEGSFLDGKMSGEGKFIFNPKNNTSIQQYEGIFKNNKFEETGTLLYKNGLLYKGLWENGKPIKEGIIFDAEDIHVAAVNFAINRDALPQFNQKSTPNFKILQITNKGKDVRRFRKNGVYEVEVRIVNHGGEIKNLNTTVTTEKVSDGTILLADRESTFQNISSTEEKTIKFTMRTDKFKEERIPVFIKLNSEEFQMPLVLNLGFELKKKPELGNILPDIEKDIPINYQNKNRYALVIGNENYRDSNTGYNVPYAINDADAFEEYAAKTLGIPERQIINIRNGEKRTIENAIEKFAKLGNPNVRTDVELFFYYAGHGFHKNTNQDSSVYLMPIDVKANEVENGIKLLDLYKSLTKYPETKVTIFLDACFSGSTRGADLVVTRRAGTTPANPKDRIENIEGNLVVFAAATGKQEAHQYSEKEHGLFTYYLLKAIKESRGNISYEKLSNNIMNRVQKQSVLGVGQEEQIPIVLATKNCSKLWKDWKIY